MIFALQQFHETCTEEHLTVRYVYGPNESLRLCQQGWFVEVVSEDWLSSLFN